MSLLPSEIIDGGDNPVAGAQVPDTATKKLIASGFGLIPEPNIRAISGNAHSMTLENINEFLLFENAATTTLNLIKFPRVSSGFLVYIDENAVSPTLGTLASGVIISTSSQATFETLQPGTFCYFVCLKIDGVSGDQTIAVL